jgi:hypothetical protein
MGSESQSLGAVALSYGVERPEREAYHSLPRSVDVKNVWRYTSTPPICVFGAYKDNLTFIYLLVVYLKTPSVLKTISIK